MESTANSGTVGSLTMRMTPKTIEKMKITHALLRAAVWGASRGKCRCGEEPNTDGCPCDRCLCRSVLATCKKVFPEYERHCLTLYRRGVKRELEQRREARKRIAARRKHSDPEEQA